ncbi:MAG: hypothetical protein DRO67_02095 [Candidatus Asgardarchaeum californiense]|nr:MAG: hypothetical protein DRO67_02095 [Candidatus Asgardarchaeum californiense]
MVITVIEKKIGFIGLGLMGSRMVKRHLDKGYELILWNRTIEKAKQIGGIVAKSPKELAEKCNIIFLMLSDENACDSVIFGAQGLIKGLKRNQDFIIVNFSTVSPLYGVKASNALKELGASYIEAPVWGSVNEAEHGNLVILLSGGQKEIEKVRPTLQELAKEIIYMGEIGKASAMKLVMNAFSLTTVALFSEVVSLGLGWNLEASQIFDILSKTWMKAIVDKYGQRILSDDIPQRFKVDLAKKDLFYALKSGYYKNIPLHIISGAVQSYTGATSFSLANLDYTRNIFRYYKKYLKERK